MLYIFSQGKKTWHFKNKTLKVPTFFILRHETWPIFWRAWIFSNLPENYRDKKSCYAHSILLGNKFPKTIFLNCKLCESLSANLDGYRNLQWQASFLAWFERVCVCITYNSTQCLARISSNNLNVNSEPFKVEYRESEKRARSWEFAEFYFCGSELAYKVWFYLFRLGTPRSWQHLDTRSWEYFHVSLEHLVVECWKSEKKFQNPDIL